MSNKFGGGSFRNGYNQGYNNNNNGNSRPDYRSAAYVGGDVQRARKHSGAKVVYSKKQGFEGVEFISAWNFSKRRGMITALISEYKKTKVTRSPKSGTEYKNLLAKVLYKDSGVERLMGALLNMTTGKITIPELGMVVNTKAPNGGYFGTFKKK